MSNKGILIQKPSRRKHRLSNLEIIAEEMESETHSENPITREYTIEATSRNIWNNFTPFQSSWDKSNRRISQSTSEGNLRQQFQLLESDYRELSESFRLEALKKKTILVKVEELEKERQEMKKQLEEHNKKLILERKNAEQIKTDYEVMLEIQNETFKRREKELLEKIDKWETNINPDGSTFIDKDSQISTINIFEFEKMSEKLESFQRQNELLQNSKEALELQNRVLNNIVVNILKSFTSLQLQYNSNKLKIEKLQHISHELKNNKTEDSAYKVDSKKLKLKMHEISPGPCMRVNEPQIHSKNEEFQNYLEIFLCKFNSGDTIEKHENKLDEDIENLNDSTISKKINDINATKNVETECNTINLSDSEKINKSNENEKKNYEGLPLKHETTQLNSIKKDQDMLVLLQRNENLLRKIEILNKEKQFHQIENVKFIDKIQKEEAIILKKKNEKTSIENEKREILEQISYLKFFIDTQLTELKQICQIFLDIKYCIEDLNHCKENAKENQQQPEEEGNLNIFKIDSHNQLELKTQIKNNTQMLKQTIVELKGILIQSKRNNINMNKKILKINVEMQEIKKEYLKFKEIYVEEIPNQLKLFEEYFYKIKELYEHKLELFKKEIEDKNSKIQTSQNKLKESHTTNEKQKMTNEKNNVENIIKDNFVSFETMHSNSFKKEDFSKEQEHKEELKFNKITSKVIKIPNWNFNIKYEGNRGETQKNTGEKYIEFANTGEIRRDHRWKQHRTRDHDRRRNIDWNTLCFETSESLPNQKYHQT